MRYIRSENLKYKRSFSRKLIFVVPIITAFVAVIFGGIRNFQAQTIYWWYTFDKKGFTLIVMLSMIAGAFPVITLVLSQELINSIVKKSSPLRYTIILFTIYIIVSFLGSILGET